MNREESNSLKEKVTLTANILFSGIGAQERGFRNSDLFDVDVITTSDISKEAVLSYAAIHCGLTNEMVENYTDYPSREEMAQYLTDINLGYEPEKDKYCDWFKLSKRKNKDLEKYWLACKLANNLGDISKIEELPYADLWTISFCCQDISVAGKMKGLKPNSGTRSSLLWDNIKLLEKAKNNGTLPRYVMFENVKNLVSKKFMDDFNDLIEVMDELGFNTYWKVLNGKECGVPQNRERVFVIAIRKDIDKKSFEFPLPFDNGLRLKDVLEDTVANKYYLSEEIQSRFKLTDDTFIKNIIGTTAPEFRTIGQFDNCYNPEGRVGAILSRDYKQPKQIVVGIDKSVKDTSVIEYSNCLTAREDRGVSNRKSEGAAVLEANNPNRLFNIYGEDKGTGYAGNVWDKNTVSPTLTTMQGGNRQPMIISIGQVSSDGSQSGKVYGTEGISQTICACTHGYAMGNILDNMRIRKLTPTECWILMGFEDDDVKKCIDIGISDTHLYKQAGNSIITNCCELIAEHLYKAQYDNTYICYDENFTNPQAE